MKRVLLNTVGGVIGGHLVERLKAQDSSVCVVDLKQHAFSDASANESIQGDLRNPAFVRDVVGDIDAVCQLAADMGGAGYTFTSGQDADVMQNTATIRLN